MMQFALKRAAWDSESKRNNLIAASLSGAIFALISLMHFPHSAAGILAGLAAGFVYANGFEYCSAPVPVAFGPRNLSRGNTWCITPR